MRSPSPSRRTAALVAAGSAGLSFVLLGSPGAAMAQTWDIDYSNAANTQLTVPSTVCAVTWQLLGGTGGDSATGTLHGGNADVTSGTTPVAPGSTLLIQPGQQGGSDGSGGTAGSSPSGGAGGAGAGGGGGASIVRAGATTTAAPLIVAPGGGGAGTGTGAYGGAPFLDGGSYTSGAGHLYGGGGGATDQPGSGGALEAGAPGTAGQAANGMTGGAGPAGAGGGGGGYHAGGSGASDGQDGAGGGGGAPLIPQSDDADDSSDMFGVGSGFVHGTWVQCTAPAAPAAGSVDVTPGDGRIDVTFPASAPAGGPSAAAATGWEVTVDDGAHWTAVTSSPDASGRLTAVIGGLTDGRAYAIRVRATSVAGPGAASDPVTATPVAVATPAPPTTATPHAAPPAPATVPAGNGPLSTDKGTITTVTAGKRVTLTGSGYAPNSAVDLYIYSTPQKVGSVVTDAAGSFAAAVTVPSGLEAGTHHLVAAGVDPSGATRFLRMDVTLSATTAPAQLAWTGTDIAPLLVAGALALATGAGLMLLARRRRAA